ncbi:MULTISPECIES: hydrogenase expression/formation protein HypE [unclassified Microbulbifer]|uniref:hydrogenase expression/formation protein HypE n=1 Tax=unclassified Microbulbifer TaxID=2619833 RepID=UPI0027E3F6DF|nr:MULTISPECIES: hydrogenase expression/formation protein HypE [unclassified Microbulbifer]
MNIECPLSTDTGEVVRLGHGSGGELSQKLLRDYVYPHFDNPWIAQAHDSATVPVKNDRVVFTTDSFVITPLFFPGGDIGKLAVYGTVNDLAMSGARPLYLSCSLILEEGLPMATLARVMSSMGEAAAETGMQLVTGDTKVVERGKGDGLYINTAGIGTIEHPMAIEPRQIQPEDLILLSGDIGRHGMAVMARREGLEFDGPLRSDCAPLHGAVEDLLNAGIAVHCLRDLTRGGLATALVELAESADKKFIVRETVIPVCEPVKGACEILGLDPLYVANEGRFVAFVPAEQAELALAVLARNPVSVGSRIIGAVARGNRPGVILQNALGCERLVARLPGEQLPRIC